MFFWKFPLETHKELVYNANRKAASCGSFAHIDFRKER